MIQLDISPNKAQEVIPVMHIPVNGVSASNQRLNLATGLVQSNSARSEAQEQVDKLFQRSQVLEQQQDGNDTNKLLGGNVVENTKVQESFERYVKEGFPAMDGSQFGFYPTGCTRVPNIDSRQAAMVDLLTPEIVKLAKQEAEDKEEQESFGFFGQGGLKDMLRKFKGKKDHLIGGLNDALIRSHMRDFNLDSQPQVVDKMLTKYIKENPAPKVEMPPDVVVTEIPGNHGNIIDLSKPPKSFFHRHLILIIVVVIGMFVFMAICFNQTRMAIKYAQTQGGYYDDSDY